MTTFLVIVATVMIALAAIGYLGGYDFPMVSGISLALLPWLALILVLGLFYLRCRRKRTVNEQLHQQQFNGKGAKGKAPPLKFSFATWGLNPSSIVYYTVVLVVLGFIFMLAQSWLVGAWQNGREEGLRKERGLSINAPVEQVCPPGLDNPFSRYICTW